MLAEHNLYSNTFLIHFLFIPFLFNLKINQAIVRICFVKFTTKYIGKLLHLFSTKDKIKQLTRSTK